MGLPDSQSLEVDARAVALEENQTLNTTKPDREEIDNLLGYLPLFDRPDRQFVKKWGGGEKSSDGSISFPYPVYEEDVLAFFRLASQPCWSDSNYRPEIASDMLEDEKTIRTAELSDIRTMLTYCVRSERFGDGNWEAMLLSGKIVSLLKRLQELQASSGAF